MFHLHLLMNIQMNLLTKLTNLSFTRGDFLYKTFKLINNVTFQLLQTDNSDSENARPALVEKGKFGSMEPPPQLAPLPSNATGLNTSPPVSPRACSPLVLRSPAGPSAPPTRSPGPNFNYAQGVRGVLNGLLQAAHSQNIETSSNECKTF